MSRRGRVVPLLLVCLAALGANLLAEEPRRPRYARRLDPPMRNESFRKPAAVTADLHTGEIFVCDVLRQSISIFDKRGVFRDRIRGGSTFRAPRDIALDPDGYIYLLAHHEGQLGVIRLDFDGLFLGVVEFSGLPELEHPLSPGSLALSPSGNRLYVVDRANHLLIVSDPEGRVENVVDLVADLEPDLAREQIYGHVDAYGDTVLLARPTLGVVDLFDPSGEPRGKVGRFGTANCMTAFPMAAAQDELGNILIVDRRRMLFTLWDPKENRCLDEFYGMGRHLGGLYTPDDLALDGAGRVYITQAFEGRVQVYDGGWPAAGEPQAPTE